jgi:hypothetical protein
LGLPKKKTRIILWSAAFIPVLIGLWAFEIEPRLLVIREQRIALAGWPQDVRVAVLSDLHVGSTGVPIAQLRNIVERTNSEHPDLIVLLGDYVIGGPRGNERSLRNFVPPEATATELQHLHAPLGVFAVLGNHDWWFDGERTRRALEEGAKIPVLENQAVHIDRAHFWLGGIADLWTRNPDIAGTLKQVNDSEPVVLITHNPDIFPDVPNRVSLTLAGHTHGGQVRLPFYGRPIRTSEFGYDAGLFVRQGHDLFVTTGIGTSIMDVRFGVPPEIVILTLTSARGGKGE